MFDDKYNEIIGLMEAPDPNAAPAPTPDPAAGGGAPPPSPGGAGGDPSGAGGDPAQQEPEKTPEEKMKDIERASQKDWKQLAAILCGVIENPLTPEQIETITGKLPGGITISDFANYSDNIKNKVPSEMDPTKMANMTAAAIKLFDYVKEVPGNPAEISVPRAEDR